MVDTPLVDLPSVESLPALSGLFDAVRLSATVTFGYRGSPRRVDPAGLRFRGGHWYLIAFDRDRGEGRTFRVDRVSSAPSVGPPGSAELPEDFDAERAFSAEPWRFGAGDETAVDVLVDPVEAGRVVAELGSGAVIERPNLGGRSGPAVGDRYGGVGDLGPGPPRPRRGAGAERGAHRRHRPSRGPDRCWRSARRSAQVTAAGNVASRLRRLLAILTWLAQVGETPIDEAAVRFGLQPDALVAELEMAACCGLPPYTRTN